MTAHAIPRAVPRWSISIVSNYPLLILLGIYLLACILVPNFLTGVNQLNLIRQSSVIGIVSLGMLVVIISAGIDLSVGSMLALSGVIAVGLQAHLSLPVAVLIGLGVGMIFGCANGAAIAFFRVSPFVMTLGTLALARGLTYAYTEGGPLQPAAETRNIFVIAGRGEIFGIPVIGLIWLALILIVAFVLNRTVFGRQVSQSAATRTPPSPLGSLSNGRCSRFTQSVGCSAASLACSSRPA